MNILNTDYGKGIYPSFSNFLKYATSGVNIASEDFALGKYVVNIPTGQTEANIHIPSSNLPIGDYTMYFTSSVPLSRLRIASVSTAYIDIIEIPQEFDFTVSEANDTTITTYISDAIVNDVDIDVNINIVPHSYPNIQVWESLPLTYTISSVKSIAVRFDKCIVEANAKVMQVVDNTTERFNISLDGTEGFILNVDGNSYTFAIEDYITIVSTSSTNLSIYKNDTLVTNLTVSWDIQTCTYLQLAYSGTEYGGADLAYLLLDKDTMVGIPKYTHFQNANRRVLKDTSFADKTNISSKDVEYVRDLQDNPLQRLSKIDTPTFKDVLLKDKYLSNYLSKPEYLVSLNNSNNNLISSYRSLRDAWYANL